MAEDSHAVKDECACVHHDDGEHCVCWWEGEACCCCEASPFREGDAVTGCL